MDLRTIARKVSKIERATALQKQYTKTLNNEQGELRDEQKKTNDKLSILNIEVTTIKNDVEWLKKFFFIVAGASVGGLVTNILMLLFK